jgi:soluble lytic murein transglycosylase
VSPEAAPFPSELTGTHAERARLLAQLGFFGFARSELQAHERTAGADAALLAAYSAVRAPGAAIRVARTIVDTTSPGPLTRYLYPLGYWETIRPLAEERGVDPLLVAALIRQESLFEPEAVSPANARGLMQLMPSTARQLQRAAGRPPLSRTALHEPATNIELGVTLLARLLSQYGGSREKALAAYNAGEDAVAKWEARYGEREPDEFVELISFRETRDYVKTVLRNHRLYRQLYAASASATRRGNPPNAPFDMITMTSPGRADATR